MPEKALTVATYAAGASLAAITLIYVFAPTYFLDSELPGSANPLAAISSRKKGVVGLANAANDCFINSVLQALAGLGDLRLYLIRETHRRNIDDTWVYARAVPDDTDAAGEAALASPRRPVPTWKIEGLQRGIVTKGLKDILDQLNERPIYKKTISAVPFVRVLEAAFRQRISRQQQDAQEFLQVVAERLCDEYHAGRRARLFAQRNGRAGGSEGAAELSLAVPVDDNGSTTGTAPSVAAPLPPSTVLEGGESETEDGFPMEGNIESQIECLSCGFKPRPSEQAFCTLTLNVPQVSSTTLNSCFDGMLKTEYIDEFKCEKCRLVHAREVLEAELGQSTSEGFRHRAAEAIARLQDAIEKDPEKAPEGVTLPDARYAPKRRIARHVRLTRFPKILAIHLSRSIYDASQMSQKNSAKVTFPENLPLGGLLRQRKYKLLGLVTHKGSHHSGHYESFRRQNVYPPYSNPSTFQASGVYSRSASPAATPQIGAVQQVPGDRSPSTSSPDLLSPTPAGPGESVASLETGMSSRTASLRNSGGPSEWGSPPLRRGPAQNSIRDHDSETSSLKSFKRATLSRISVSSRSGSRAGSRSATPSGEVVPDSSVQKQSGTDQPKSDVSPESLKSKRKKHHDRWWRISDEKIKEASTREVLAMQREVYLLFYELEREA